MSVFVFDHDTICMIRYIIALQRFKEYSVGPQGIDEYLCAESFNRVLIQTGLKFPKFQKENQKDLRVNDVIRFLEQKSYISPTTAQKLREYMDFHDTLINTSSQTTPKKPNPKTQEILQFLCTEAGLDQVEELKNKTFKDLSLIHI